MDAEQNPYDSPRAELGGDSSPLAHDTPMRYLATLWRIFVLYGRVVLPVSGYVLLWGMAHVALVIGGGYAANFLGWPAVLAGTLATMVVFFYFWTIALKHMDDVYRGRTGDGRWSFALGKMKSVLGTAGIKLLALAPVFGLILFLLRTYISYGPRRVIDFGHGDPLVYGGPTTVDLIVAEVPLALLGAGLVLLLGLAAYLFIHFADVFVVVEDCNAKEGVTRAMDIIEGWRQWAYAASLFFTVFVLIGASQCLATTAIGSMQVWTWQFEGLAVGLASLGVTIAIMALIVSFGFVANYVIFQSLRERKRNWAQLAFDMSSLPDED